MFLPTSKYMRVAEVLTGGPAALRTLQLSLCGILVSGSEHVLYNTELILRTIDNHMH